MPFFWRTERHMHDSKEDEHGWSHDAECQCRPCPGEDRILAKQTNERRVLFQALRNYCAFYGRDLDDVQMAEIGMSAAGIKGWSACHVLDAFPYRVVSIQLKSSSGSECQQIQVSCIGMDGCELAKIDVKPDQSLTVVRSRLAHMFDLHPCQIRFVQANTSRVLAAETSFNDMLPIIDIEREMEPCPEPCLSGPEKCYPESIDCYPELIDMGTDDIWL